MTDPWSSVEAMLRWQIERTRTLLLSQKKGIVECGELYPLPKPRRPEDPPHGLPKQWAFGDRSPHAVSKADSLAHLLQADRELGQAEASLAAGNLPSAIAWIINANASVAAATAKFQSGSSIAMWRYVDRYRKGKALVAKRLRPKVLEDGEAVGGLIKKLAASAEHAEEGAQELWNHFYAALEENGASPKEEPLGKRINYTDQSGRDRSIAFGHFANEISKFRRVSD